ncbi:transglycosylase family protein [Candidatus Saccharibacteria bacterium]|nr:transglycosylase family protein [Candidatus Saccharibacteria bacterium]
MSNIIAGTVATIGASLLLASSGGHAVTQPSPTPAVVTRAPVPTPAPKTYTVASGDSLSAIASTEGLDSWRPLWNVNTGISDPNLIYPNQQLTIPTAPTVDRPVPAEQAATAAALDQTSAYNTAVIQRSAPTHAVTYAAGSAGIFARIRVRESGGNYAENTGNGYYGAYQYDLGTWGNYDGYARPDLAPPAVQDAKAAATYAARGCSPWPNTCY